MRSVGFKTNFMYMLAHVIPVSEQEGLAVAETCCTSTLLAALL